MTEKAAPQAVLSDDEELELLEIEIKQKKLAQEKALAEEAEAQVSANKAVDDRPFQMDAEFYKSLPDQGISITRSMAEGATLGISEPVISGTKALVGAMFGDKPMGDSFGEDVKNRYMWDKEVRRAQQAYNPGQDMAGELLGSIMPWSLGARAAKLLGKGLETGYKAAKVGDAASKSTAAYEIGKNALSGAVIGTAIPKIQEGVEVASGFLKPSEMNSVAAQAGLGAGIGAAATALPMGVGAVAGRAGKASEWALKKFIKTVFGVPEEAVEHYLQDPQFVRQVIEKAREQKVPPFFDVIEQINEATQPIKAGKAKAVQDFEEARRAAKAAKEGYRFFFNNAKKEGDAAALETKQSYKQATLPMGFQDEVEEAVADLGKKLSEESNKSYQILELQDGAADVSDMYRFIVNQQKSLYTKGQLLTDPKQRAFAVLQKYKQFFKDEKELPFPMIKQIIQDMDTDLGEIQAKRNAGEFNELPYTKLMETRRYIDSKLKAIEPFAEQMKFVHYLWELKDKAGKFLGRPGTDLAKKLEGAWRPDGKTGEFLSELGEITGRKWTKDLAEFSARRQVGANPTALKEVISATPEVAFADKAQQALRFPNKADFGGFDIPPEFTSWMQSEADVIATKIALQRMQAEMDKIAPFLRDDVTGAVRKVMLGKNPTYINYLKELSQMTGQDFEREIKAARTAEYFMMNYTQGSKRVNFGALLGSGMLGAVTKDPVAAVIGSSAGAVIGAVNDSYGSTIAQKMVDGFVWLNQTKTIPTVRDFKIAFKPLPSELKNRIVEDLVQSIVSSIPENYEIAQPNRAPNAFLIQASQGLSPIEKAKAKLRLERDGVMHSSTIQKMMLEQDQPTDQKQEMVKRVFKQTQGEQ